jgi:hypothetical protein
LPAFMRSSVIWGDTKPGFSLGCSFCMFPCPLFFVNECLQRHRHA